MPATAKRRTEYVIRRKRWGGGEVSLVDLEGRKRTRMTRRK